MSIATEILRLQQAKADIKAAIEEKGVNVGDGTIDTYAEKINEISGGGSGDYDQGYEDGKNTLPQWDRYTKTTSSFMGLGMFNESVVVLNFDNMTELQSLFFCQKAEFKNTKVEHLTINSIQTIGNASQMLRCMGGAADTVLKRFTFGFSTANVNKFYRTFDYCTALETIDGLPIDFSSITDVLSYPFYCCTALVDVRFVANSIKKSITIAQSDKLSTDTIQSIIDGLVDLTGGTAQTLTLHATVGGKLTDEQKATITAKNWELVY